MGPTCPGPPGTPPPAAASWSPPPPRNDHADADSSAQRKRPRLDSGTQAVYGMSIEPSAVSEPQTPPPSKSPVPDGTPSQMTINVRPLLLSSSPTKRQPDGSTKIKVQVNDASSPLSAPHGPEPPSPEKHTPEGSSSPEIEAAEPEDMDEAGPSVWFKPLGAADSGDEQLHSALLDEFPYAGEHATLNATLNSIRDVLTSERSSNGATIIRELTDWLEHYLKQTETMANRWFELCAESRDFWDAIPEFLADLVARATVSSLPEENGDTAADSVRTWLDHPMPELLRAYATLTARMLQIDAQTLRDTTHDQIPRPDLMSGPYLQVFSRSIRAPSDTALVKTLKASNYDIAMVMAEVLDAFQVELWGGWDFVTRHTLYLLDRAVLDEESLSGCFECVRAFIVNWTRIGKDTGEPASKEVQVVPSRFFTAVREHLQGLIHKQRSSLRLELLRQITAQLSRLLRTSMHGLSVPFQEYVPTDYVGASVPLEAHDHLNLVDASWKMALFMECITRGHMDARIFGVDSMQELMHEFFSYYVKDKRKEAPIHPVAGFVADAVCQHQLLQHLVGVGSHPQLISRGCNILLFLIVTNRYTAADTETVWQAMRTSQDPRVADAICDMAWRIVNHNCAPVTLQWFDKFCHLPTADFDGRFLFLCHAVTQVLLAAAQAGTAPIEYNLKLHRLYVRLLQEVFPEPTLSTESKQEIKKLAASQLRPILQLNLPGMSRVSVFTDCLVQISQATPKACGSGTVLAIFFGAGQLEHAARAELLELEDQCDFVQRIIEDFSQLHEMERALDIRVLDFPDLVNERLTLITTAIVYLPTSITSDLAEKLWWSLVGHGALNNQFRNSAWHFLGRAIALCNSNHYPLIGSFVKDLLPALDPSFFTPEALTFAENVTALEVRTGTSFLEVDGKVPGEVCFGDILWTVALKSTDPNLAAKATDLLVQNQRKGEGMVSRLDEDQLVPSHPKFVDKAVKFLRLAARELNGQSEGSGSSEDEAMVIVPSKDELAKSKMRFQGSLAILMKFVDLMRTRTLVSPRAESIKSGGASAFPGKKVSIRYQAHSMEKIFDQTQFEIGDQATVRDLSGVILARTGFQKIKIIASGLRIDQEAQANTAICELPSLTRGQVIVQKIPVEDSAAHVIQLHSRPGSVEEDVMRHFSTLYNLLDLDFGLGREVYQFLSSFAPHPDIVSNVCNGENSISAIFPMQSIFKCMYGIYALQNSLNAYLQEGITPTALIAHGVRSMASGILALDAPTCALSDQESVMIVVAFADTLVMCLKEPVPAAVSASYFDQPSALVDRLSLLILRSLESTMSTKSIRLIELCFKAILEASLHDKELRSYITSQPAFVSLLKTLILDNSCLVIREAAKHSLASLFGALGTLENDEADEYYSFFWSASLAWIPEACEEPYSTKQFFESATHVFLNLSNSQKTKLPLAGYVEQWSGLLCEHKHHEFVGRYSPDWNVQGLAELLRICLAANKTESSVEISDRTIKMIFRCLLFAEPNRSAPGSVDTDAVPVLECQSRGSLYRLLLAAINSTSRLQMVVGLCKDLMAWEPTSNAWTWGFAQPANVGEDWNENRMIERNRAIRAPTGYPGLRNLTNTCYMNSLLVQLFMNTEFRAFMLSVEVSNSRASTQRLVYEIKRIFSYLQHSWLHAIDPENVAQAVITYEGAPIDVTVQMDVDEFYNLILDRIEGQIPHAGKRQQFRELYGGQIVQQIKSRDCEHISERLEPFSAIQCEIQNKQNLSDSLQAYVEGEVMEGDNKYSCTSCGSYVNAVKRACLKDVPDNLILHLKRFDFDLATGTRSKINDRFEFPVEIDMAPYNVEYLQDTRNPPSPDIFSLVGVLVHSGSAEAGHYYSYIRDTSAEGENWLEFNDSEVTPFDPSNLAAACYGGWGDHIYGTEAWQKPWSAYMLFYRRKSVFMDSMTATLSIAKAKSATPREVARSIQTENEAFIQQYCMFDEEHGKFATALLQKHLQFRRNDICSDNHTQEKEIVDFALDHMDQIFARQKDGGQALLMFLNLRTMVDNCHECAEVVLEWFLVNGEGFFSLLLRCLNEGIRQATADLVRRALQIIRETNPASYGSLAANANAATTRPLKTLLPRLCQRMKSMLLALHEAGRGWDDFYGLLLDIAQSGSFERAVLRKFDILIHCIQVLAITKSRNYARTLPKLQPFVKASDRRHFSYLKLITLVEFLLREAEPVSEDSSSGAESPRTPSTTELNPREKQALSQPVSKERENHLAVLEAVFQYTQQDLSLAARFVGTLLQIPFGDQKLRDIVDTIISGTEVEPKGNAEPWLRGAAALCEHCRNPAMIRRVVKTFARETRTLETSGGGAFLEFFQRVRRAHNLVIFRQQPHFFKLMSLEYAPVFGPSLLYYQRLEVRQNTLTFLQDMLRVPRDDDDEDDEVVASIANSVLQTTQGCVDFVAELEHMRVRPEQRRLEQLQHMFRYLSAVFLAKGDVLDCSEEELGDLREKVDGALETIESIATSSSEEIISSAEFETDSALTDSTQAEA